MAVWENLTEPSDWNLYAECLDHYLAANDVANAEKKLPILLSSCGASMYKLIMNLTLT